MDLQLNQKVVILSGATGGIGSAMARRFLEEQCRVSLIGRSEKKLRTLKDSLDTQFDKKKILLNVADCDDAVSTAAAIEKTIDEWSKVDVVIANVGNGQSESHALPSKESFSETLRVNLRGAETVARATAGELIKSKGNLIVISSIAGLKAIGAPTDYSVAKAALIMLAKQLSNKLAPSVRVNCIAPGNIFFRGGRWDELSISDPLMVDDLLKKKVPLKRFGTPEDIANAAAFLSSDKAKFITGVCLAVDGGQCSMG